MNHHPQLNRVTVHQGTAGTRASLRLLKSGSEVYSAEQLAVTMHGGEYVARPQ